MSDRDQRILDIARALGVTAASPEGLTIDSPAVPEGLGRALAEQLREYRPAGVVFWTTPETSVLAHVVARELGVETLPADEDQGRLTLSRRPVEGSLLVAVDIEWNYPGLLPLIRTVAGAKARVVAAGTVLQGGPPDDAAEIPLHALQTAAETETHSGGAA